MHHVAGINPVREPSWLSLQVSKEVEEHGDIVLVREKTNYKSILLKTFFVLEYAIKHYDVRFILKTDDDAYVHVEALVHQLRLLCISPDCRSVHHSHPFHEGGLAHPGFASACVKP